MTTTPIRRQSWRRRAACRDTDPSLFFPETGGNATAAKRICAGCPVRAECLDYAVSLPERYGVFGGLDERERYGMNSARHPLHPRRRSADSDRSRKAA